MKIVLITGMSGTGKTSIAKNLCERYTNKYNFIQSYTDRGQREKDEWGHTFISSIEMDTLLEKPDIIAQTKIEKNRYCTIREQFDNNKINLYTVDVNGINDTIEAFPEADFMTILVRKREIEADCVRLNRNVNVPARDDVDFLIDNDGKIESAANLLNTLVNFDFFYRRFPSTMDLQDRLDQIDMQYRFLDEMKSSLYEQMWYARVPIYRALCGYVENKINEEFDFKVTIEPDTAPEIYDGCLTYNLQAKYDDDNLMWDEINRLVERMAHYAYQYCENGKCDDIIYRLAVSECWSGEDEYR